MFTYFCEILIRALDELNNVTSRPKDVNMKISQYIERYGTMREKKEYHELSKWFGCYLNFNVTYSYEIVKTAATNLKLSEKWKTM